MAQAQAGVGEATVTIRDRAAASGTQPDGTWGPAEARLPVALESPAAPETGWSFAFERPDPGLYVIELTVVDLAGSTNPAPVQTVVLVAAPAAGRHREAPGPARPSSVPWSPMRGRATAPEGVAEVGVAVKDRVTGLWWRADGTWGAFQRHAATVALPDSPDTTWSFDWASPGPGSYGVQVRAVDAAGLPDPEPRLAAVRRGGRSARRRHRLPGVRGHGHHADGADDGHRHRVGRGRRRRASPSRTRCRACGGAPTARGAPGSRWRRRSRPPGPRAPAGATTGRSPGRGRTTSSST